MTNNKQQNAVEWFFNELKRIDTVYYRNTIVYVDSKKEAFEKAKQMYQDEIEAAAIISSATSATSAASANTEAFADGYRQGYNRALELSKWAISNLVPPHNEKK